MSEIRPIPFAPGYFVSDDGCVYSEKSKQRIELKPWENKRSGHLRVTLRVESMTVKEYVHRLVALVFQGSPPTTEHETRHLDGNPKNNALLNLTWGTHTENMQDMVRHGTQGCYRHPEKMPRGERHGSRTKPESVPRGERIGTAKVTEAHVRRLRSEFAETGNISEAARRVEIPRGAAKCIVQGKTWKHVA